MPNPVSPEKRERLDKRNAEMRSLAGTLSLDAMAEKFNLTPSRVRQILRQADAVRQQEPA
jgi:DNA-directed RNA polymerase sigma subunit (sigma70/sigma32)